MKFVLQWIDVAWLVMAFAVAKKDQRGWVVSFFIASMVMMRMLVELMTYIGYPNGITGLIDMPVHSRALIIYSLFYFAYIAFFHFSPNAKGMLLMAGSIAFFFASFFTTATVMIP
ncbi:MAG: hypothetical protein DYH13_09675 [Alphaproteobacteria bacterium PRO2]|nr:hypothetical protein [Alphaproteobacteria bacterium PRO2]